MRIVSKQVDYYDCIQKTGQDKSVQYIRTPREEILWTSPFPEFRITCQRAYNICIHDRIIGFCGKIYPIVQLSDYSVAFASCYSATELEKLADRLEIKECDKRDFVFRVRTFFATCERLQDSFTHLFDNSGCPIFVATCSGRSCEIQYNALLRPYNFAKVFDPQRAFQTIFMYLSNLARPEKPIPQIPDSMKIYTHGFDKHSFRTCR